MNGFEETTEIAVPVRTAYDQWTQFESFPRFMAVVRQVEQLRPAVTRWVVGVGPARREFHAEVVEQHPDSRVRWRSLGRQLHHEGSVSFEALAPDRTLVSVRFDRGPWDGFGPARALRAVTRRVVRTELARFTAFIEGLGDAGETWRGTIHHGRVRQLRKEPPRSPGWIHG